jgi:hypothetical protein
MRILEAVGSAAVGGVAFGAYGPSVWRSCRLVSTAGLLSARFFSLGSSCFPRNRPAPSIGERQISNWVMFRHPGRPPVSCKRYSDRKQPSFAVRKNAQRNRALTGGSGGITKRKGRAAAQSAQASTGSSERTRLTFSIRQFHREQRGAKRAGRCLSLTHIRQGDRMKQPAMGLVRPATSDAFTRSGR